MTVHLVGAGPGDPGLITVRGAEVLAAAEVVVHDRLSAASLLDLAPPDAELINVGKSPDGPSIPQERINELLVEHGLAGRRVVRLKGGDPFIFARGAEEAAALEHAGVDYEVVPGITSAIAAPAYAGIPVTMRYSSTSLTIVTGHEDPSKQRTDVDWEAIARVGGTIVILMGVANLAKIVERLVVGGLSPDTPAAAVRWGTRPDQTTVRATLATLADHDLAAPSTIVVGDVAAQQLRWFEDRPLFGRRVVVTRSKEQAGKLAGRLVAAGAEVVEAPTIEIAGPGDGGASIDDAIGRISTFDWVVLSSPNGVEAFTSRLRDGRDLAGVRLAVVGPGTAAALAARGLVADLLPDRYVAEGLLEVFPDPPGTGGVGGDTDGGAGGRVLVVRAAVGRDVLVDGLAEKGWQVELVEGYRTVPATFGARSRARLAGADAITFTSSSSVRNFVDSAGVGAVPPVVVTIGPITSATARELGLEVSAEADPHSLDGLVDAVHSQLARGGADGRSPRIGS